MSSQGQPVPPAFTPLFQPLVVLAGCPGPLLPTQVLPGTFPMGLEQILFLSSVIVPSTFPLLELHESEASSGSPRPLPPPVGLPSPMFKGKEQRSTRLGAACGTLFHGHVFRGAPLSVCTTPTAFPKAPPSPLPAASPGLRIVLSLKPNDVSMVPPRPEAVRAHVQAEKAPHSRHRMGVHRGGPSVASGLVFQQRTQLPPLWYHGGRVQVGAALAPSTASLRRKPSA